MAKPAGRALASAGVKRLEDLTRFTEAEIAALHGMGPKVLRVLQEELGRAGLSFRAGHQEDR
jgi:hypothetical protein